MAVKKRQLSDCYHTAWAHLVAMDKALRSRKGMMLCQFAEQREINRSTARRYLDLLIDRFGMPITRERHRKRTYPRGPTPWVWRYSPRGVSLFSSWAHKWML